MIVYPILITVAFLTSVLSGMIGMGGGMLLLAAMFSFLTHAETIPAHAAVQLVSNSTRVAVFWQNVDWRTIGRFSFGAVVGGAAGIWLLYALGPAKESEPYLKLAVGIYILLAANIPIPADGKRRGTWWDFPLLGLVSGTAALTFGAVGPLIAPLFARRDFVKHRLVATKAVCQMLLHVVKIPAFLWLRPFDYSRLGWLTLAMIAAAIPGTLLGKRLLGHVSDVGFIRLYRLVLNIAGLKIFFWDGIAALVFPG